MEKANARNGLGRSEKRHQETKWFTRNFGRGWPGAMNDRFEDDVAQWRREDKDRKIPD